MQILVNGAGGRMGKVLCGLIADGYQGAALAGAVDTHCEGAGLLSSLDAFTGRADCIVDFSHHSATSDLLSYAVSRQLPTVIATTGQTDPELALIREAAAKIPLFFSGNMSMGVALLAELARLAAKMFPEADVEIVEKHHNQKLDVPSGTALMLARSVQSARPNSTLLVGRHENGKRTREEIGIHSLRLGNVVGEHEVILDTGAQMISLKHEAHSRALFAEGALSAAAFLIGKQPGLYEMSDIIAQA